MAGIVDFFPSGPHHHKHHHTFPHQHHHKRERRTCEPDEVCGIDFCILFDQMTKSKSIATVGDPDCLQIVAPKCKETDQMPIVVSNNQEDG